MKSAIKQRLCDQFIQKCFSDLDNSAREFYKVVKKKDFKFEEYLIRLSKVVSTKFWYIDFSLTLNWLIFLRRQMGKLPEKSMFTMSSHASH
jgi:hypothetical protein